jgi:hypothetical protein
MITLKHRRATAAILSAANPTLAAGEFAVESDTGRIKIGNGSTAWASLGYFVPSASDITQGTLAAARLPSTVALNAGVALTLGQPASVVDVFQRGEAGLTTVGMTSGTLKLTLFTPLITTTISQITAVSGNTAASGLTLARMGIYTFDETTATLVARVASDTTLFTAINTAYTRSLDSSTGGYPASYTLTAGVRYAVGVLVVGTTMPTMSGRQVATGVASLSPRMSGDSTGRTDLPTTTTLTAALGQVYARLS